MAATVGFSVAPRSPFQIGLSAFVLHYDSGSAPLMVKRISFGTTWKIVQTQESPVNHKMPLNPRNS